MTASEPPKPGRWTMLRRRDLPHDHGSLIAPRAPVPEPDDDLEVFDVVPASEVERLQNSLQSLLSARSVRECHRIIDEALSFTTTSQRPTNASSRPPTPEHGETDQNTTRRAV